MIVLGLDPGIARTGFGVVNTAQTNWFVRCGCLTTTPEYSTEERLAQLGADLELLVTETRPDHAVVEQIFFGKNTTTAFLTAHTRGVLLYILQTHHIPILHMTPLQIKSRLTGHGRATKHQIQLMTARRLHLNALPQPDDAADGLAAALCGVDALTVASRTRS